jgi:two-component system, LytTR family, sensor kinase
MIKLNYPLKKLSILNLWFITVCTLFIFSFMILFWGTRGVQEAMQGALLTLITLSLTCFANILWLHLFKESSLSNPSNNKKVYYTISYFFSVFVFLAVVITYNNLLKQLTNLTDIVSLAVVSIFVNTLIVIFNNYFVLQDAKINADMENSQLKAANSEAANQLLRQQIHPHFFFNALNILKSLYKLDPEAAEEYLVSLSDFLRVSLSSDSFKVITLKDELKLCEDYLGMQKIRFGEALICNVTIADVILENGFVPSFSIQPLLENAIKHNELTKASPLHIFIEQDSKWIKVSNNIKTKATTEISTGIGLANLSKRYQILSGDEIILENNGATFSVSIKILDNVTVKETSQMNA